MTPEDLVNKQHEIYNAGDIDAYIRLWAKGAKLINMDTGDTLVDGIDGIKAHYTKRFSSKPKVHCDVLNRIVAGRYVIDHERVEGIEDKPIEIIAVYQVEDGLITSLGSLTP